MYKESANFITFLVSTLFIITALNAQNTRLPINVDRVVDQCDQHQFNNSRFGEFLINTNYSIAPSWAAEDEPQISFDGTNFFLVWLDSRLDFDCAIYGARVNHDGVVIDTGGIPISTIYSYKQFPGVSFDGTNYFVVWYDIRNGNGDIYGARVTTDGIVLDPQGIPISVPSTGQIDPAVGFDGTNFLVVWSDARLGTYDIYGARVTQSGTVLDPQGFPISTAPELQGGAKLAFDGTNYLVAWSDYRNIATTDFDIYGARVTPEGTVLDTLGIPICTAINLQGDPRLAFDGTNYFIIWYDCRAVQLINDLYGTRITTAGTVLDTAGILIAEPGNDWRWSPSIAFDGVNYLAVWEDRSDSTFIEIYGKRINPSGMVLDTLQIPISTGLNHAYGPCLAFDGVNYLAAWSGETWGSTNGDIYGKRISPSGIVQDSLNLLISNSANYQNYPAVGFDGVNYLVVWSDNRNDLNSDSLFQDIYGSRITPSGVSLDPGGFPIATGIDHQIFPSIAFDGTNYLVVYDSGLLGIYDVYGVRVSPAGIVLDTTKIPIAIANGTHRHSSVAFDGTNYFALWDDTRLGPYDIYGARITPSGTVLDPTGLEISGAANDQMYPSIAFGDTDYFAVWQDKRIGIYNIYGTRINTAGIALDTLGIAITIGGYDRLNPDVTFDGLNYFVVWQDNRNSSYDIYGARVTQSGMLLDTNAIIICAASGNQESPTITFDGMNYVVIWQDSRFDTIQPDLYGAKVSSAGIVIDSFVVSSQPGRQILPDLAHGPGDQVLVAYSGWTDSINHHPASTMRIWGKLYPPYGIEETQIQPLISDEIHLRIFPNPVRRLCNIQYTIANKSVVKLSIYDVTGRLIKNHITVFQNVGVHKEPIDFSDYAQGVYYLLLKIKDRTEIKKIILIK